MNKELKRMQKLAGVPVNEEKESLNEGILGRIKDKFFNKLVNLPLIDKLASKIVDKMSPEKKEEFTKKYSSNLNEGEVDSIMDKVSSLLEDENSLEEQEDEGKKNEAVQKIARVLGQIAGINMMMLGGAPLAGILTYLLPGGIFAFPIIAVANVIISAIIMKMSQKITGKDPLNEEKESLNEHYMAGGIVGMGAINQIPPREKSDYEMAFEHFMTEGEDPEEITGTDIDDIKIPPPPDFGDDEITGNKLEEEDKEAAEVSKLKSYLEGAGKSALQQINKKEELKSIFSAIFTGMSDTMKKNPSVAKIFDIANNRL